MKQRILASIVVFTVGFGIGLGLTWALLARAPADAAGDPSMAAASAGQAGDALDEPLEQPAEVRSAKPAASDAPDAEALNIEEPESDEPQPELDEAKVDEAKVDEPKVDEPKVDEAKVEEPGAEEPKAEEPKADEPEFKSNAWWKGLSGQRMRVDLGGTKALTIRRGDLEDGEKLEWVRRFGTNSRVGLLYATEKNMVTVHGVATNAAGTPVAAKVTYEKDGQKVTGIIALRTQGLKVTLYPVD